MKHVRSLLFFLAAVFLVIGFTSNAVAQKIDDYGIALADVDSTGFSDSTDTWIQLEYPDTTGFGAGDTVTAIGAERDSLVVQKFMIFNGTSVDDTVQTVRFTSACDTTYAFSRIALYREGVSTPLMETTTPGAFAENEEIAFSGINNVIAHDDTAVYYFEVDINSDSVDGGYDGLYAGIKISGGDVVMALSGTAPAAGDIIIYPHDTPAGALGRLYYFDTKPPDLVIEFDWIVDNGGGCTGNGIVNLGDSILILAWDSTDEYEIDSAWAYMSIFGSDDPTYFDSITVSGSDSAAFIEWMIPDTTFTGSDEVSAGFYWLVVGAVDPSGNQIVDSILLPYAIDTRAPVFDGDSVWVSLYYDANGDGIAAVDDTVTINAWMTSNPIGEISTVTADLTNWGYGAAIALADESGDRKFVKKLALTAGTLDLDASDSAALFWVTAFDNACNFVTDSNLAHFGIDNEIPVAPTITYTRQYDWDTNNKINIGDSIKVTVDASGTTDLDTLCEVSVDLLTVGLAGIQIQCIEDTTAAGIYTYTHLVGDGGIYAVDVGASSHEVEVTLTDDAGNSQAFTSPVMLYPVDTDPPSAVANLAATRGACAIELDWDSVSTDDSLYLIFWDGGDGWDVADTGRDASGHLIFLDTLGSVQASAATTWTTDGTVVLTHGTTYQFVVRTIDDANNREYNFHRVSEIADCQPPVACITNPATGGAYGTNNDLEIIAESSYPDVDGVVAFVRDADLGSGTPGSWHSLGAMNQPGGGGVFTLTIDSADLASLFGCVDDSYQLITVASDEVGNSQTIAGAIDSCGLFDFDWFCETLPVELIAVNDTVSAQTSCGFNVTRDANNTVEIDVTNFVSGETFTIDVWVIYDVTDSTRVVYEENIAAMPHTFTLDATEFPQGTQMMKILVVRNDGNMNTITVDLCVPDEDAPVASIVKPVDGQYVHQTSTMLDMIDVWAKIDYSSYDFTNVTKVEFYEALYTAGETPVWGSAFDIVTSMTSADSTWRAVWDNSAYSDGDVVALMAIFYDDEGNTYTTPFVTVIIDATRPVVALTTEPVASDLCGVNTVSGYIDLIGTVTSNPEDVDSVVFYYCLADSPDIFAFYQHLGQSSTASTGGIYKLENFNTAALVEGRMYRFRAIAYDISGNTMYDYDGDGFFDDNTFDATNNTSDMLLMADNTPVQYAFSQLEVEDGTIFPTPSYRLGGAGVAYGQMGNTLTLQAAPIPSGDTCCQGSVIYYWMGNPVGQSSGPAPYEVTFDPLDYIDPMWIADDYVYAAISLEYTDCFGQISTDTISFILLDTTPNDVVFVGPFNGDCVGGEVDLTSLPVSDYNVEKIEYYYRPAGTTTWTLVGSSTDDYYDYLVVWTTIGLADGDYELGVVSYDNTGLASEPSVITVTVANTPPTVAMATPADMSFINDMQVFTATVTGSATQVTFQYKQQTAYSWSNFGTDYFSPWEAQWEMNGEADGYYHIRARVENCAGAESYSEWITVFLDRTDPRIVITDVNGYDTENSNDPYLDLTGADEATVTAAFFDDLNASGNSGIDEVAFYLIDSASSNYVRVMFVDPEGASTASGTFDITGLYEDVTYYFVARAFDNTGNYKDSYPVYFRIFDETAPVVAIAGYLDNVLFAYDWSGDATSVLFERLDGDEWVGIGVGEEIGSTRIYYADWVPETGVTYTLRVISGDNNGNYDDTNVLTTTFSIDEDGIFTFGTTDISVLTRKNDSIGDIEGVVRVSSPNGRPVVLAVYDNGTPERIYVDRNQQDPTYYQGSFDASSKIDPYGIAVFFASYPNESNRMEISANAIVAHEIHPDFGTNGYVQALDSMVRLEVSGDATDYEMSAIIMETWIPEAAIDQDHFSVVPNPNGNAWFIGCDQSGYTTSTSGKNADESIAQDSYSFCCFNENAPAVIRLPYDEDETGTVSDLAVAWWDPSYNEWVFTGILFPAYVEGFNTEDHYVEFASNCLYGLYAVVTYRELPEGPATIDLLGESYCGYYPTVPTFKLSVVDRFSGIDESTWNISVDDMPIAEWGDVSDDYSIYYDDITNNLWIYWFYYYVYNNGEDTLFYWNEDELACGAHTLTVGVKNNQGAYSEETFDITVDCAPPQVTFENSYVGKNPTIEFYVTDDLSGVDTSTIHVDVVAIQTTDTNVYNPNQYESLFFLQTFFPGQITIGEDGLVSIPTTFELEDERAIAVIIYDGYKTTSQNYGDPVYYGSYGWYAYYVDGHGIKDCVGNVQTPIVQILAIDVEPPSLVVIGQTEPVTSLAGCVRLQVADDGDGFDVSDIAIYEDGLAIERVSADDVETGTYSYTTTTGIIEYCVTPGVDIEVVITDGAGNKLIRSFGSGDPTDIANASLSINPWDPNVDGLLVIDYNFTGDSEVKIYDFGGDIVKTLRSTNGMVQWNGMTEDGTRVACGVYFGYITASSNAGTYSTVVKIAIVEK